MSISTHCEQGMFSFLALSEGGGNFATTENRHVNVVMFTEHYLREAPMKIFQSYWLPLVSALGLSMLSSYSHAAVFVCSNDACSNWTAITQAQLNTKSTDGEGTTILQTLSESSEASVVNGYNSTGNTNLYLKNSLWHIGGVEPIKGKQHVTAYVYKSTDLNTRLKTCHAFSYKKDLKGPYFATCQ